MNVHNPDFCWSLPDVNEPLGERSAAFCEDGRRLEALHIRADISADHGFRSALIDALQVLSAKSSSRVAPVHLSAQPSHDASLTLITEMPSGVRLSEILQSDECRNGLDVPTAISLAYEVLAAVHGLTVQYPGLTHGALSAE